MMICQLNNILSLRRILCVLLIAITLAGCDDDDNTTTEPETSEVITPDFYFGADLSYVNQILNHNGVYKDKGQPASPYKIFKDHGANLVRFRLWHNPEWTKAVYGDAGMQQYSNLADVEKGMRLAKEQGMFVLLDLHYSDTWTDPATQDVPAAWAAITSAAVLQDSVYQYTLKTLRYLNSRGLMPAFVQIGNETNTGMLYTNAAVSFPKASVDHMDVLGGVINSGIRAVREVAAEAKTDTQVVLHVADPQHVDYWFTKITTDGRVTDFDIIGISYYPLWHTVIKPAGITAQVQNFKTKFSKDIMIVETAYPWTSQWNDDYANQLGGTAALEGYPYTQQGQYDFMVALTEAVRNGGGKGVIYWEPAWITSGMKDFWGEGSSWENAAFFDYNGNAILGMDYMMYSYE